MEMLSVKQHIYLNSGTSKVRSNASLSVPIYFLLWLYKIEQKKRNHKVLDLVIRNSDGKPVELRAGAGDELKQ